MAEHRYKVCGVVVDTSDHCRRFDVEVIAVSEKSAYKNALKSVRVGKRDLVRDVCVTNLDAE